MSSDYRKTGSQKPGSASPADAGPKRPAWRRRERGPLPALEVGNVQRFAVPLHILDRKWKYAAPGNGVINVNRRRNLARDCPGEVVNHEVIASAMSRLARFLAQFLPVRVFVFATQVP